MRSFSQGVQAQSDFRGFCGGEGQPGSGEGFHQISHRQSIWTIELVKWCVGTCQELGKCSPYGGIKIKYARIVHVLVRGSEEREKAIVCLCRVEN